MELKKMKRSNLTEQLNKMSDKLVKDAFFITSFRATKDNSIQMEVCQNRLLGGRKRTLLGAVNHSDARFGSATTLLFDWVTFKPEDLLKTIPTLKQSLADLEAIAKTWDENSETGSEAIVFPAIQTVKTMVVDGDVLTPIITVTEATESEIKNGKFFTASSKNQEENIRQAIEEERRVMKTGSNSDADYIVHPETGDRIFRYTRTEFLEENPKDTLISGKITRKAYEKNLEMMKSQRSTGKTNPEDLPIDFSKEKDTIGG